MIAWEYCCQEIKFSEAGEIEAALLLLGDKGWEAVCMIPSGPYLLLKRSKTTTPDRSIDVPVV